MKNTASLWQAPEPQKVPDFIICGAMKSGTTSLHAMLNQHPDIFIADKELHFFDCDNPLQHPDFNAYSKDKWYSRSLTKANYKQYWLWYAQQFGAAKVSQKVGEDSTTYLASPLAAKRIAQQDKKVKLIVMLRQPSKRAFSNYWHLVRTGRAPYSFEKTLLLNPYSILNRSLYLNQIQGYLRYFAKAQIKFVVFEEFLQNKQAVLRELCEFIGVDGSALPTAAVQIHENKTTYPKFYRLQLLKNRYLPMAGNVSYQQHFNSSDAQQPPWNLLRLLNGVHRKINPLVTAKPMPMAEQTKRFLDDYFQPELLGLSELIEKDINALWFS
jgi:hypothetical protein